MPNTPRGAILANFRNARQYRTGIFVEGWFDVFGLGAMAIPVLGSTITNVQQRLFAKEFGQKGRSGVILLDPEECDKIKTQDTLKEMQQRMPDQIALVKLPPGTDPGTLDRKFMRDYIEQEAKDQGVKVWFSKVKS